MQLPKSLQNLTDSFASLPGIGPKTAQRLAFYMFRMPKDDVLRFSDALRHLKEDTKICKTCYNVSENDECAICKSSDRNHNTICVVETPLDVIALEKSSYKGVYHVLHGVINPVAGIGPDEIFIEQLFTRIDNLLNNNDEEFVEIILATSTSLEGEATAMFINKEAKNRYGENPKIKITRIGKGLPLGADIEFTDEMTLRDALEGRVRY